MKKRLLKDLPFENIKKGEVISDISHGHSTKYCINRGDAYYSGGSKSSNGCSSFSEVEESILDAIWNNPEWFVEAELKHIDIEVHKSEIILRFDSQDMADAQDLARGIQHWITIHEKETSQYVWDKFKGFTTEIK